MGVVGIRWNGHGRIADVNRPFAGDFDISDMDACTLFHQQPSVVRSMVGQPGGDCVVGRIGNVWYGIPACTVHLHAVLTE